MLCYLGNYSVALLNILCLSFQALLKHCLLGSGFMHICTYLLKEEHRHPGERVCEEKNKVYDFIIYLMVV